MITTEPISLEKLPAQLSAMLALFKANQLVEILALFNNLLALVGMVYASNGWAKLFALLILLAGISVFYFAIRIRIDKTLFERWDKFDTQALDAALKQINPQHTSGRSLEARLDGSYQLFRRGLYGLVLQFGLLLILAWFYVPKVLN